MGLGKWSPGLTETSDTDDQTKVTKLSALNTEVASF